MSNCSVCFHCGSSGISAFRRTGRRRINFAHPIEEGAEENTEEGTDETDNDFDDADDELNEVGQTRQTKGTGGEEPSEDEDVFRLSEWVLPMPLQGPGSADWPDGLAEDREETEDALQLVDSGTDGWPTDLDEDRTKLLTRNPETYTRIFEGPYQAPPESEEKPYTGSWKEKTQNRLPQDADEDNDVPESGDYTGEPPIEAYGESPLTDGVGDDLTVDEPLVPYGSEDFNELDIAELFESPVEEMLLTSDTEDSSFPDTEPEAGSTGFEEYIDINDWNEVFGSAPNPFSIYSEWDHTRNEKGKKKTKGVAGRKKAVKEPQLLPETTVEELEDVFDDILNSPDELQAIHEHKPVSRQDLNRRLYEENIVLQNYNDDSIVDIFTGEITQLGIMSGRADRLYDLANLRGFGDETEHYSNTAWQFINDAAKDLKALLLRNSMEQGRVLSEEDGDGNQYFLPPVDIGPKPFLSTTIPRKGKNGQLYWPGMEYAISASVAIALSAEGSAAHQTIMERSSAFLDTTPYSIFTGGISLQDNQRAGFDDFTVDYTQVDSFFGPIDIDEGQYLADDIGNIDI